MNIKKFGDETKKTIKVESFRVINMLDWIKKEINFSKY